MVHGKLPSTLASLNAIEAPPRPFQGLGRSLHGAYCIAQLGVICYIKFVSARPLPCVAWELPSTLASLNAIKDPPQALEGPGEEPSWCILYSTEHQTGIP